MKICQKVNIFKKKAVGLSYFIYPRLKFIKKIKKNNRISFGASDLYRGTLYVLNLIKKINLIIIVKRSDFREFFNQNTSKINSICKTKIKILNFSKTFRNFS